jgi:glutamate racemase
MNILIPIVKNSYEMSDTIKAALISALISIIGFIATNRSVKRDFKNEILKQRNEIALNKMATMPMRILELLGTIIETGGQNEELAKEFDGFMNEVYAYGSDFQDTKG